MLASLPLGSGESMLLIEDEVLNELNPYRQTDARSCEGAGVLLGYRRADHIHIVQATLPGADDVRSRFSFWRRDRSHQEIATREWHASGETKDYVGEWHTHPEPCPAPSSVDLSEWRALCQKREEPLIFLILGTEGQWLGVGRGVQLQELQAR
jgi:integrative and conjugative element protein (TIGR02256 family)